MLVDSRQLADGHAEVADLVVIGAGAAGISLACELDGTGRTVLLLESGGLEFDVDRQVLNDGESVGWPGPPLVSSRLRYFGGTTGHWTGQCAPLDPFDFTARPWVAGSGWPVSAEEMQPFYERALQYCELGPISGFDAQEMSRRTGFPPLHLGPEFETTSYQMSPPTRFGSRFRRRLEQSQNVKVCLFANAVDLTLESDGETVREVTVASLGSRRFKARAGAVVLASGGIENPRILLSCNSQRPTGLGNENDLVGRYFMDHLFLPDAGTLVFGSPESVDSGLYDFWNTPQIRGRAAFRTSETYMRARELLNMAVMLVPTYSNDAFNERQRSEGEIAFAEVVRSLASAEIPSDAWRRICQISADRRQVAGLVLRRLRRAATARAGTLQAQVKVEAEQSPFRDSRVTLSRDHDRFGVPKAKLDWRIRPSDLESIRQTLLTLGTGAGRVGLGRFRTSVPLLEADGPLDVHTQFHHMGTTRMGDSPATSVVDRTCRVHSLKNLFVAGSSVFTTGGRSNPTLTIVALAVRLADHLRQTHPGGQ